MCSAVTRKFTVCAANPDLPGASERHRQPCNPAARPRCVESSCAVSTPWLPGSYPPARSAVQQEATAGRLSPRLQTEVRNLVQQLGTLSSGVCEQVCPPPARRVSPLLHGTAWPRALFSSRATRCSTGSVVALGRQAYSWQAAACPWQRRRVIAASAERDTTIGGVAPGFRPTTRYGDRCFSKSGRAFDQCKVVTDVPTTTVGPRSGAVPALRALE